MKILEIEATTMVRSKSRTSVPKSLPLTRITSDLEEGFINEGTKLTLIDVTPDVALEFLEYNTRNRKYEPTTGEKYARSMKTGNWLPDPANPILVFHYPHNKFLANAQHRLNAVLIADTTVPMYLMERYFSSLQEAIEYLDIIDTGRVRTLANQFEIDGVVLQGERAKFVADLTKLLYVGESKNTIPPFDLSFLGSTSAERYSADTATYKELLDTHRDAISRYIDIGVRAGNALSKRPQSPLFGALYHFASRLNQEQANYFFEHLISGADLPPESPILRLRNDLILTKSLTRRTISAYFVKSWNAFRSDRTIQRLRWKTTGKNPDKFPEMR